MADREIYKIVHEQRNNAQKFFQPKWDEADENKRFIRMAQYSADQLNKYEQGNRVPYVLDFITQPINTYIGDQRDSRTDIKYLPVEANDEVRAEVLNAVKDTILRRNRWIWLESDIFMDGIIEKAGAVGYEWSTEKHPLGSLSMFRVPVRQLMWDVNRREYDLGLGSWVSRTRLYAKNQLKAKFPEFADEIENLTLTGSEVSDMKLDESYYKELGDTSLSAVALIEYYERQYKDKFFVRNSVDGIPLPSTFNSEAEAKDFILRQKANESRLRENLLSSLPPGSPIPPEVTAEWNTFKRTVPVIFKSEVASNLAFTSEVEQDMPFYPYDVYYPFWEDGEYWSVMDMYKDPQRFINKMFSMVDHQIATNSKGMLLIDESVPEEKAKAIIADWSKTGGAQRMPDPKNNVVFIQPQSFDSKLLDVMQAAMLNIEKKAGGANFLGQRETAGESGVAVARRTQRASIASFMIYDNLDRFKLSVGEKVAWYISNYMTAAQKIRIEGDQLSQFAQQNMPEWLMQKGRFNKQYGFMEINTNEANTLDDLQVDIVVDQSAHAATKNQATLELIQRMLQSSPLLAETMPPQMLIELFDLPASKKREMIQQAEQLMQARQEQAKAEANKPPTLSANLKDVSILPAEVQAQFLAMFGLKMEDGQIIVDQAAEADRRERGIKLLNQNAEMEVKKEMHDDKMALNLAKLHQNARLEREKLYAQSQKGKENGQEQG